MMRLKLPEIVAICATVNAVADASATVHLFGSRVDDRGRAGDIDLLVKVETRAASASASPSPALWRFSRV